MKMNVLLFYILCLGIILFLTNGVSSGAANTVNPVVLMGTSQIIGKTIWAEPKMVHQYLGIPYATPPVGDLRFKQTVPLKAFPKIIRAHYQPPACHQYTKIPFPWYFNETFKSEDCLYLNIWAPADASPLNPKPVLYFIHSGQFRLGSPNPKFYSGEVLAARGDIVVVTVAYRLGSFGFLYTGTQDAEGNQGLYDVFTGLKWVNENIACFGGDASQITLGGQSSAAVMVGLLTHSVRADGLYSKLIMESGSPTNLQTEFREKDLYQAKELAKRVGCATDAQDISDPEVTICLKSVPENVLEMQEYQLYPNRPGSFYPLNGDADNATNPRRNIFRGKFNCKPLLIGNVRDEGSIFVTILDKEKTGFFGKKDYPFNRNRAVRAIDKVVAFLPDLEPAVGSNDPDLDLRAVLINNTYENVPDGNPYCLRHEVYTGIGDIDILCPTVYYAEQCAEQGKDVYYYFYVHRYSNTPFAPWMGVTHFSEVQFVFGLPFLYPGKYTNAEKELSEQMIKIWTDFVKYGKPGPDWPKYSRNSPIYKVIGGGKSTKKYGRGPHKTNCDRFRKAFRVL